jgi:hypothetical protein
LQFRDSLNSSWTDLSGRDGAHSFATLFTFPVQKGADYELRYRVKNVVGWSGFSPISSFTSSDTPSEPEAPILIDFSSSHIKVELNFKSVDDGGIPL